MMLSELLLLLLYLICLRLQNLLLVQGTSLMIGILICLLLRNFL